MSGKELFLIAVGLSMDAFAVSICQGLAEEKASVRRMFTAGVWFGGFQALMPFIGYELGTAFSGAIEAFDHWIAFILLVFIGGNMLREAASKEKTETREPMFLLALAASIDALAVGVTFALLPEVDIQAAVLRIGVVTFIFSAAGIRMGAVLGVKYKAGAEWAGGLILIGMGVKILVEHLLY